MRCTRAEVPARGLHARGGARAGVRASLPFAACLAFVALLAGAGAVAPADAQSTLRIGDFSASAPAGPLPAPWQGLAFRGIERHTLYDLVRDPDRGTVVRAVADASASALAREVDVDPRAYPVIRWRWRAENLVARGDVARRDGDDYPVRLYVTFAVPLSELSFLDRAKYELIRLFYGRPPPLAAVSYIWDGKTPVGTVAPNPFTAQVRMIVVESGPDRLGRWLEYERDLREDYLRAFGREPPRINGIALMTDTDNTREQVRAFYGDIEFVPAR